MASDVDICNMALSHLGDSATVASIDPPEGSAQAEHCQRFYPIARDITLAAHYWGFATRRAPLALLSSPPATGWQFAYVAPGDCLAPQSILAPNSLDQDTQQFEVESDENGDTIIYTNQQDAVLRYTRFVEDSTKFSPLCVEAMAWLLGAYLAGPIIKGDSGIQAAQACYQQFQTWLARATARDANQRKVRPEHNPEWLAARGVARLDHGFPWGRC